MIWTLALLPGTLLRLPRRGKSKLRCADWKGSRRSRQRHDKQIHFHYFPCTQSKVRELKQWQAAWAKHSSNRKTASKICSLRLAMGTPCFNSGVFPCTYTYVKRVIDEAGRFFRLHFTSAFFLAWISLPVTRIVMGKMGGGGRVKKLVQPTSDQDPLRQFCVAVAPVLI